WCPPPRSWRCPRGVPESGAARHGGSRMRWWRPD
ncbi:MAG: hypothetical protein AVDCRST_MAG70-448, partial [uncultured Thermomicrobiales bacterium]